MTKTCLYLILGLAASVVTLAAGERKIWALLIAGSRYYTNYRHQADICHAYQILHAHGIPDEQIVVMMYDDIAHNNYNPYQGNIINRPGGPNVYPGVPKDYTGKDVNAETFLKVLQGDQLGVQELLGRKGKVINSGPDDYVFINFADHGGPGILGMPEEPYLKARPLNDALKKMYADKKFAKLTFYVEACESGSIFDGLLPENISVYVTTAANPDESSYGCYCDNDRATCLGDLYSVNWMENSDSANVHTETLETQYELVRDKTNMSHVMQYGDEKFTSLTVDQFIGTGGSRKFNKTYPATHGPVIPTDEVGLHTLQQLIDSPVGKLYGEELKQQLEEQRWLQSQTLKSLWQVARHALPGRGVAGAVSSRVRIQDWDCYERGVDLLFELCPRLRPSINDFVLTRLNVMVNLCNTVADETVMDAIEMMAENSPLCFYRRV